MFPVCDRCWLKLCVEAVGIVENFFTPCVVKRVYGADMLVSPKCCAIPPASFYPKWRFVNNQIVCVNLYKRWSPSSKYPFGVFQKQICGGPPICPGAPDFAPGFSPNPKGVPNGTPKGNGPKSHLKTFPGKPSPLLDHPSLYNFPLISLLAIHPPPSPYFGKAFANPFAIFP